MGTFYVDVESISSRTYQVEAENEEQAKERVEDHGVVISSETTVPTVIKVSQA